jgi:hypothetical protein
MEMELFCVLFILLKFVQLFFELFFMKGRGAGGMNWPRNEWAKKGQMLVIVSIVSIASEDILSEQQNGTKKEKQKKLNKKSKRICNESRGKFNS